jgi:hypothetical protein
MRDTLMDESQRLRGASAAEHWHTMSVSTPPPST